MAKDFERPVGVKFDAEDRPHVVEQTGRVWRLEAGRRTLFLDLHARSSRVSGYSERGLLDIAFPPDRGNRVVAHYTDRRGDTVLAAYPVKDGAADAAGERVLLRQNQPYANHNGGQIEFGPDGFLYMALGDGGSAGDPRGNAQRLDTWLGKLLRLDVSSAPYSVPGSNPFFNKPGTKSEIWAYGLRNPWRFSFDGTLVYVADVGQDRWEEIDVEDVALGGGRDYGWNVLEGEECCRGKTCDRKGRTPPVLVYGHERGDCSVTGGYVYRGTALPELQGVYFYGDWCTGRLASFRFKDGKPQESRDWPELNPARKVWGQISSFGRDHQGELYIVDYRGALLKLIPSSR